MLEQVRCFTNNPLLIKKQKDHIVPVDGSSMAVLQAVRQAVLSGRGLLTHPLAGGWQPGSNPYKSVVISAKAGTAGEKDLYMVDQALARVVQETGRAAEAGGSVWDPKVLEDFQYMDSVLVEEFL